jgi:hypothetical protein
MGFGDMGIQRTEEYAMKLDFLVAENLVRFNKMHSPTLMLDLMLEMFRNNHHPCLWTIKKHSRGQNVRFDRDS